MALILNNIQLPLAFRRAQCLVGDDSKSLFARRCLLIYGESEVANVTQNDFVFILLGGKPWDISVSSKFFEDLSIRGAVGICLCGDITETMEKIISETAAKIESDLSIFTISPVEENMKELIAELSSDVLEENNEKWFRDRFFSKLPPSVENNSASAKTYILWLENYLGYQIRLLWAGEQIKIPSLKEFELDAESATLLSPILAQQDQNQEQIFLETGSKTTCAFVVRSAQEIIGYLVVSTSLKAFPQEDASLIRQCLPYITIGVLMELQKKNYLRLTSKQFFHDLLFSKFDQSSELITENAELLGYDAAQRRRVLAMSLPPKVTQEQIQESILLATCQLRIEYQELFDSTDSTILILIITEKPEESAMLPAQLRMFREICNKKFSPGGCQLVTIGVGTPYSSLNEIASSYQEAVTLLNIGYTVNSQAGIYYLRDYLLHYVVFFLKESPAFLKLYSDIMDKLQYCRTEEGQGIMNILTTLSKYNFSVQQAASSLFLHRNSLYDRIKSISNILQMNLKEQEQQLLIHMLLILHSLLSQPKFLAQQLRVPAVWQKNSWTILWNQNSVQKSDRDLEVLKFEQKLHRITACPYNLESLLLLANNYLHHPIDLISAKDFSGFTKHNSLVLLNIGQILDKNSAHLYNSEKFIYFRNQQSNFVALKITQGNYIMAYLTVNYGKTTSISIRDTEILEKLAPFIATWLMTFREGDITSKSDLYMNLLNQNYNRDENKLQRECLRFGIPLKNMRFVCIITVLSKKSHIMEKILEMVQQCCADMFHIVICGIVTDTTTLLFESIGQANAVTNTSDLLGELAKHLNESAYKSDVKMSVSKLHSSLFEMATSYREANISMTIGKVLHPDQQIYNYKDYITYDTLCNLWENPALRYLYHLIITPILSYDKRYRANLMKAVEAYSDANFCISTASNKSQMHRNTLYKKVAKAQEILGMDFSIIQNQIAIQLAIKIKNLRKISNEAETSLIWVMDDFKM